MHSLLRNPRFLLSLILAVSCISSIGWYAWYQHHHFRNLHAVKTGVLYRSGQLTPQGLERVIYEKNIGTVINLRGDDKTRKTDSNAWEEKLCTKNFTCFVSIPLCSHDSDAVVSPSLSEQLIDDAVQKFLDIMSDPVTYPRPVLIHCLAGVHRTGVMVALYRMECQGWSKEQAIAEMRQMGYTDFTSYDPLRDYVLNWKPLRERKSTPVASHRK